MDVESRRYQSCSSNVLFTFLPLINNKQSRAFNVSGTSLVVNLLAKLQHYFL